MKVLGAELALRGQGPGSRAGLFLNTVAMLLFKDSGFIALPVSQELLPLKTKKIK